MTIELCVANNAHGNVTVPPCNPNETSHHFVITD
jgi:hypothetical protein